MRAAVRLCQKVSGLLQYSSLLDVVNSSQPETLNADHEIRDVFFPRPRKLQIIWVAPGMHSSTAYGTDEFRLVAPSVDYFLVAHRTYVC